VRCGALAQAEASASPARALARRRPVTEDRG
jgi:hypothetical protein